MKLVKLDDHWQIIEKVKELTGGKFCERVIECTGKEWPLNLAGELTAERGKLIIAGFHQDGMRSVNVQLWNWRGLDVINAHERDPKMYLSGIAEAVKAVVNWPPGSAAFIHARIFAGKYCRSFPTAPEPPGWIYESFD